MTDCIQLFGILPWCTTATGGDLCALPGPPSQLPAATAAVANPVIIAIRTTVNGDPCRLPLVVKCAIFACCRSSWENKVCCIKTAGSSADLGPEVDRLCVDHDASIALMMSKFEAAAGC